MKKIGITGSLASGKSTASNFFIEKGHLVISADKINENLLKEKTVIKHINMLLFNEKSNVLDKKRVAKVIFSDNQKKKSLEDYLHPLIYKEIETLIKSSLEEIVFLEIPLLYETNFRDLVDYVIVVYSDINTQIKRLEKRDGIDEKEAIKRINVQMPIKEKLLMANYVIDNSKSIENTNEQLNYWYINYMRRL